MDNSLPRLVVTLHVCVLCVYITCRSVPALLQFIAVGEYAHLDGFVLELPGEEVIYIIKSHVCHMTSHMHAYHMMLH